jgi:hypothetical protein
MPHEKKATRHIPHCIRTIERGGILQPPGLVDTAVEIASFALEQTASIASRALKAAITARHAGEIVFRGLFPVDK